MTKLLHIDTQTLVITRYLGKEATHQIKWLEGSITSVDLDNFLHFPDLFIKEMSQ